MTKINFNHLAIEEQIEYFNLKLNGGKNINQICKSIQISYSTIRDRFKRNSYFYNKLYNQYENINTTIHIPEISEKTIDNLITKIKFQNLSLECERRDSKLTSRSFRLHTCVLSEFIDFCNNSNFTQQEILTQFIAEGLTKYQNNI